ncbi:hypothetical protein BDU57DRAFT_546700 [Ampelomyces quisqualis]|uniref:DOMON domain-containing protein n=1 Tax=Ampelomyces quisqualis TaxID=50730 RepID=A0A6A5QTZ7_AMPQU|nr:hypothetical protein BDU57DRAFT_546700 [Ampelomyces quisqualis]
MRLHNFVAVLATSAFSSLAHAQISEQCVSSDVCYRLNIPASTARTGSGEIYLSIRGPTTNSWIALGQGSNGMDNANIFMIYTDGNGNVTLSPRHSRGETMPLYDSAVDAELLSGSGVQDDIMTANLRCNNCEGWQSNGRMDFTASSGGWIHARSSGGAMDSSDVEAPIAMHSSHGEFTWPFASAVGGASINPFAETNIAVNTTSGGENQSSINTEAVLWCHGVFASVAFVLLFPLGGVLIRVGSFPGLVWVHAGLQLFAWLLFVTAAGLGIYYGVIDDYMSQAHPIIGILLLGALLFQPLSGWLHHKRFIRTGGRSAFSYSHIWVGRVAILLGMINGGLGMQLSGVTTSYIIVYSVFAGIMGVAYLGAIGFGEITRKRERNTASNIHEMTSHKERATARRSSDA